VAQIFVSHSSADNALALRVRECLGDLGYDSVFLDVSPTDGLIPGAAWRDQLFTNLDRSDALVFLGTPAANASQWCHSELALVRWLRKPVLALLFDGVDPHELVADIQGVNLATADLSADLLRPGLTALGLEQATRWDAARSPFPGLRPFDESYAPVFFGRERQVAELRQLVDPPSRARQGLVVPVLGPSGSGKSSLVRAGLVAALRPAPDWVVSDPWTPSDAPLAEMCLTLAHAAKRHEVALDADECRSLLTAQGGMSEYLRRLREAGNVPADARVLVVVDQAEELVTLTGEAERRAFLEALALSCVAPSPLRVVMTARTDMWDGLSALTNRFGAMVAPTVLHVPPLSRADLARVVAEPAKRSHLTIEDGLLQRLVEDTETGDALPLLAYTLSQMTASSTDGRLTHALYDDVGGVRGAIASRAAEVAHGTRTEGEVAAAILHIVGTGESRPVTRLAQVDTVPSAQREILDDLVDARLVLIRESAGHQVYAPAHEALFTAWPPLADMIEHRQDDLRLRSRLERRAADWHEAGTGGSGLLSGDELAQATTWEGRNPDLRTAEITAYVAASGQRARRTRLLRIGVASVVAALVLALVVVVLVNARADRNQARAARVGELAAIAERELVHDPAASAVALLQGLSLDADSDQLATVADRLLTSAARDVATMPGEVPVVSLQVGDRLAVTNGSSEQLVWDVSTGQQVSAIPTAGDVIAIRPDDRIAVVSSTTEGMSLWDLDGTEPGRLALLPRGPARASFSPDGRLLATATGTLVTLWNVAHPASPTELAVWNSGGNTLADLTVTDDGAVLTSGDQALVTRWRPLADGPSQVLVADVPPQGTTVNRLLIDAGASRALVSVAAIGAGVSVYDLATGKATHTYVAGPGGLANATSTTWAASADQDLTFVVVFDLAGRGFAFAADADDKPYSSLVGGHTATVTQADVTPDGMVVTGAIDGTIRVWDPGAASYHREGDVRASLCAEFGSRIDDGSRALALGDEDFNGSCPAAESADDGAALDLDSDLPEGAPAAAVVADDFEQPEGLFTLGSYPIADGITLSRSVSRGRIQVSVAGGAADYHTWSQIPLGLTPTAYDARVRVEGIARGRCGLTVGDGNTRVNVVVDPSAGTGTAVWFVGNRYDHETGFTFPPHPTATLSVSPDGDALVVRVDGDIARRLRASGIGPAVDAGLATLGGTASCTFDDFALTLP